MKTRKDERILKQLRKCGISNGVWIDAGCGRGTYTFPLATIATQVIAIDKNPYDLSFLKSRLHSVTNIVIHEMDFNQNLPLPELVDGILFGFSLHYEPTLSRALHNAFNQLKSNGIIIVLEYIQQEPLPWVPFPVSKVKLIELLSRIGFDKIDTIHQSRRFYIVRGIKSV